MRANDVTPSCLARLSLVLVAIRGDDEIRSACIFCNDDFDDFAPQRLLLLRYRSLIVFVARPAHAVFTLSILATSTMELELPVIYLLPTHLSSDELQQWEEKIPSLTWDAAEASFIVGKSMPP